MTAPYYSDEQVTLHHGDSLSVLRGLTDQSVSCCVTSPPYFGLRDYGQDGQYGLESSPAEYIETMRAVFAEVRRVLADDGTLWLNLGDSYSTHQRGSDEGWDKSRLSNPARVQKMQFASMREGRHLAFDRPNKSLLGMPWRTALALQDDGWILRNDIIWAKPNAMPESVTDRLSSRHEHVFMLAKSRRYWFDRDAISEPAGGRASGNLETTAQAYADATQRTKNGGNPGSTLHTKAYDTRAPGDVWTIPTQPFAEAHFAVMPAALAERAVLAGCKPGGVVLDPFSGSGTTGLAATKHGLRAARAGSGQRRHRMTIYALFMWGVLLTVVVMATSALVESQTGRGVTAWLLDRLVALLLSIVAALESLRERQTH
jgi:DNA modification methylase